MVLDRLNCLRPSRGGDLAALRMTTLARRDHGGGPGLDALGALAVLAVAAGVADDEHGAALAAAGLVGRHDDRVCGSGGGGGVVLLGRREKVDDDEMMIGGMLSRDLGCPGRNGGKQKGRVCGRV